MANYQFEGLYSILTTFKDFQGIENETNFFQESKGSGNPVAHVYYMCNFSIITGLQLVFLFKQWKRENPKERFEYTNNTLHFAFDNKTVKSHSYTGRINICQMIKHHTKSWQNLRQMAQNVKIWTDCRSILKFTFYQIISNQYRQLIKEGSKWKMYS